MDCKKLKRYLFNKLLYHTIKRKYVFCKKHAKGIDAVTI